MIIMKKFFSALFVVLFASTMMAQTGLTCDDPIPVNDSYRGKVDGPCTLWYTANTYDLPLTVHFSPNSNNSTMSPEVYIDFTCTPGVYEDPNLDELINLVEDFDLSFPLEFMCDLVTSNGKNEWDLSVNESYREQMAEFGITYNVKALVKVTFFEGGEISLKPDTLFKNCMEKADPVALDKTIQIIPNDSDRVFVMPYTDWQDDSIQFVWNGEGNLRIWLATYQCDFVPEVTNGYVWTSYELSSNVPYKLQAKQINDAIANNKSGGLFYAKMLSSTAGELVVEKVPMGPIQGNAKLLEYNQTISLQANETSLFCFPRTWGSTQFVANAKSLLQMYASNTADFTTSEAETKVLGVYTFGVGNEELELSLSSKEIGVLAEQATDDYIYVRFLCQSAVDITPKKWSASDCADKSLNIYPSTSISIAARSSNTVYRLNYEDYKGYGITIEWQGNSTLPTYIADTCAFTLSSKNARLVLSPAPTIKRNSVHEITAEEVAAWESRVDADGMLYVRFNPTNAGYVNFISSKPVKEDSPCVLASTLLEPSAALTINLDKAFDIYRIDYQAWLASGVKLVWTGVSPLHTFVAKDCEFAVAIYHKDVVNYTEVPAEGNVILSKDILATLGQYVDEDGYLYIRFLTELEGILTTAKAE